MGRGGMGEWEAEGVGGGGWESGRLWEWLLGEWGLGEWGVEEWGAVGVGGYVSVGRGEWRAGKVGGWGSWGLGGWVSKGVWGWVSGGLGEGRLGEGVYRVVWGSETGVECRESRGLG